jgi:hypothetical protein
MISIEHDWDQTSTIIMDPSGKLEDIQVISTDTGWYIRQWDDNLGGYDLVEFSHDTFKLFLTSLNLPEGLYTLEVKK